MAEIIVEFPIPLTEREKKLIYGYKGEIVRCKDCVHLELLNSEQYYARCSWHGRLFPSFGKEDTRQWFCADGERRE